MCMHLFRDDMLSVLVSVFFDQLVQIIHAFLSEGVGRRIRACSKEGLASILKKPVPLSKESPHNEI